MSRGKVAALVVGLVVAALGGYWLLAKKGVAPSAPDAATQATGPKVKGDGNARGGNNSDDGGEPMVVLDDDPEGTLRLEGLVVDGEDKPVAGAEVTVSSNPPRTAKSGEDGSFGFDKLVGRPYELVARAGGRAGGPITARLTATSDPVVLKLAAAASVTVKVIGAADGKPVKGAEVELRDVDTLTATANADGKATFDGVLAGGHQAVAWAPGYGKTSTFVNVPPPSKDAPPVVVTIQLARGAAVSGVVNDPTGKPIAGALVMPRNTNDPWAGGGDPRRDAVETGADGKWKLEGVSAGSTRFVARHEDYAPGSSTIITLDGVTTKAGVTIALEPAALVAGRVVDAAGAPAPGAVVRVAVRSEGWANEDTRQAIAGADGRFELKGLARKAVDLAALAEKASSETVHVDLAAKAEQRDVELRLARVGTISGTVVDGKGEPIADAAVWAMPNLRSGGAGAMNRMEWSLRGGAEERTDAGGAFTIAGLSPGEYWLRASKQGAASGGRGTMMRDPVEAKVGDANVKITIPADGKVKGKVALASGGAPGPFTVALGMGAPTPFAAEDGSFELDLAPGHFTLTVTGLAFDRAQVPADVKSGETTDVGTVTVKKGRMIAGRVLGPDGAPVPGATVVAGRRLFGSGTRTNVGNGGGGPMRGASKDTITDERGEFSLAGVGAQELALVAEHESIGRSTTVQVPAGDTPVAIDLKLAPFAVIQGKVTSGGKPAEATGVNVSSQNVPATNYIVQTGPDGTFRFDHLAPDTYLVQAVTGRGPMMGMGMHTIVVAVGPAETKTVAIDIPAGTAALLVKGKSADGRPVSGQVRTVNGPVTARTARAMERELAATGPSFSNISIMIAGNPVRVANLPAGQYTACVVAMPTEVRGMGAAMDYLSREGDNLPVSCGQATVGATDMELVIDVVIPAYVPLAGESAPPPRPPGPPVR